MKSYCCETEYLFCLEVYTISDLAAADVLETDVECLLSNAIVKKGLSDVVVNVIAKMYDDEVNGEAIYKVSCGFTYSGKENLAFEIGCDVDNAFERLGHVVKYWNITANKSVEKTISREQERRRQCQLIQR